MMNANFKKILITLTIFIVSTILIYFVCTFNRLLYWCKDNQLILFNTNVQDEYILNNLNSEKINLLGEEINNYAELLEESKNNENLKEDTNYYLKENGQYYAIAELYDPIGFSVWNYIQSSFSIIFSLYIEFSIFSGLAITLSYIIIKSKKINSLLKVIFGYFGVILIIPQIYSFFITNYFAGLEAYKIWNLKTYLVFTLFFFLILFINYLINNNISKKLNIYLKK